MRHVVVVTKVALKRVDEFFWTTVLKAHSVIDSCVVYQNVQPPMSLNRPFHSCLTIFRCCEFKGQEVAGKTLVLEFGLQLLPSGRVAIERHCNRPLLRAKPNNGCTNPLYAASHEHNPVP
jgi:hypothetical protein